MFFEDEGVGAATGSPGGVVRIAGGRSVRVAVIDDHEFFRGGLTGWIRGQRGIALAGEGGTVADARELLRGADVDLLILDLGLPDGDGMDFIGEALGLCPGLRIVVLSQREEAMFGALALRKGADGYVMKSQGAEHLREAIEAVMAGATYFSPAIEARLDPLAVGRQLAAEPDLSTLSDREVQVFSLLGADCGPKEIASRLGISVKTVETYRDHLKAKLSVASAGELTLLARRWIQSV